MPRAVHVNKPAITQCILSSNQLGNPCVVAVRYGHMLCFYLHIACISGHSLVHKARALGLQIMHALLCLSQLLLTRCHLC